MVIFINYQTLKHARKIQKVILNTILLPVFDLVADVMKLARIKAAGLSFKK